MKQPDAHDTSFSRWFDPRAFAEVTLAELLENPLVRLLMSSDGVDAAQLRALLATMAKSADPPNGGSR